MDFSTILNKSKNYAFAFLNEQNVEWRVSEIDGRKQVVTRDYNPERLNLVVRNDRVVDFTLG